MSYPKSERGQSGKRQLMEKNPDWLQLRRNILHRAKGENLKVFNPRNGKTLITIHELPLLKKIDYLETKFKLNGSKQVVAFALIKLYEEVKEAEPKQEKT